MTNSLLDCITVDVVTGGYIVSTIVIDRISGERGEERMVMVDEAALFAYVKHVLAAGRRL